MASNTAGKSRLSAEFWAIIGVGVMLAAIGFTAITLGWNMYARLDVRMARIEGNISDVKERLSHIEGWIQGRFREGAANE